MSQSVNYMYTKFDENDSFDFLWQRHTDKKKVSIDFDYTFFTLAESYTDTTTCRVLAAVSEDVRILAKLLQNQWVHFWCWGAKGRRIISTAYE